ncbi:quinone oxidoreductase-like [Glandiceps talaboti]
MRAVRVAEYGEPEVMRVHDDVPIPEPSDNQVLIKIRAAGVNPWDSYLRQGLYTAESGQLPFTPGVDAAGIVHKVGSDVRKVKPGDRVFTDNCVTGSYAEYGAASEEFVYFLPDNLTFQQGAVLGVSYFTAYRALFKRGNAKAGEKVLIHGASGAVGIACLQLGGIYGLHMIGTAGSQQGLELIKEHGAEKSFNHREEGYMQQIEDTVGKGVDVIIENAAHINLQADLEILDWDGRIVLSTQYDSEHKEAGNGSSDLAKVPYSNLNSFAYQCVTNAKITKKLLLEEQ